MGQIKLNKIELIFQDFIFNDKILKLFLELLIISVKFFIVFLRLIQFLFHITCYGSYLLQPFLLSQFKILFSCVIFCSLLLRNIEFFL